MKNKDEVKREDIIYQNYFQEKTKFEIVRDKIQFTLFGVLNILLKFEDDDFMDEVIDLLNETCQFLYYPFYDPMGYLWKKEGLFNIISSFLAYFQTVVFFNNTELYTVFFYLIIGLVVGVVIDVGYVSYIISSKNKSGAVWPMRLLRSVVSYIVTVLFNPMVEYLLAILECSDKDELGNQLKYYQNYNVDDMHCWTNVHFTVMCYLGVITTVIFCLICTVVMFIFYDQKTSMDKTEAKTSSYADIVSLFVKTVLILIYSFLVWTKSLHWIVCIFTFILAFFQFYAYWTERPFYEERTNKAFFLHTGIVFFSTVVLLFLKFLQNAEFDGGIFILFIGGGMVSYIIITQQDSRFNLLLTNINKFSEGGSVFKQVRYLLELIDKSHEDRQSNILLKGYLYVHEESCTDLECPLKKYLEEMEKKDKDLIQGDSQINQGTTMLPIETSANAGRQSNHVGVTTANGTTTLNGAHESSIKAKKDKAEEDLYLYEYVMNMYQNGISKFPLCTSLRINYSFFLMERMNNTKKALIELKNCEKYNPNFEEQFLIFRYCENSAGEEGGEGGNEGDEDEEGLDIVANIAYKNHFNTFKEGLKNVTSIYNEFWSLLINNTQKTDEDLLKMNEYGDKINKLIEGIKSHYVEMEKLKYNDEEVLQLYSDFYQDILNDRTQAEYYKGRLRDIQGDGGQEVINSNDPADTTNENIDYIFLAAEGGQIGKIVKLSPNLMTMLGYTPNEIIGKNVDFIMPELFHNLHNKLLADKASRFKTLLTQNVRSGVTGNQKANFKELFVIAKNKLNNAVPLLIRVNLIYEHEINELFFIGRIYNQELYDDYNSKHPKEGIPPVINFNRNVCYVLTNLEFIVQYYTANANIFLGFKVGSNGNIDISKNISEYGNVDDGFDTKKMTKGEIFLRRYAEPKVILWKTLLTEENDRMKGIISNSNSKWDMQGFLKFSKDVQKQKDTEQNQINKEKDKEDSSGSKSVKQGTYIQFKRQRYKEDYFLLKVSPTSIKGNLLGYIFRFELSEMDEENMGEDDFDEKNSENSEKTNSLVDINPSYIPELSKKFKLNVRDFYFSQQNIKKSEDGFNQKFKDKSNEEDEEDEDSNSDSFYDWHHKLREIATEKINKFREKQKDLENEEEEEENEEEDENEEEEENENESRTPKDKSMYSKNDGIQTFQSKLSELNNEDNSELNENNNNQSQQIENPIQSLTKEGSFNKKINFNKKLSFKTKESSLTTKELKKIKETSNFLKTNENNENNENNEVGKINYNEILNKNKNYENDYYHVKNINALKFLIYDFKKERLVEVPKIKRESQVEYKKKEGVPNFISAHLNRKKIEREEVTEEENEQNNETAEAKRIEYALQKEQFQPEIVKLKWTSFSLYVCLLAMTIVLLILIIKYYGTVNEYILMLNNSRILQTDILLGLYYVRELTLLTMLEDDEKYKIKLYNKTYFVNNITSYLNSLFDRSYLLEKELETTSTKWSNNLNNILINTNVDITIIGEDLKSISINTQAFSAITELLGNLFEIINTPLKKIFPLNNNVYFYTKNAINPVLFTLKENFDNLIFQYENSIEDYKNNFILILIFTGVILLIGGIFIKIILDKITRRKSGYLGVFFLIENKVCQKALDKCDKYSKILNPVPGGEEESIDSENDSFIKKKSKIIKQIASPEAKKVSGKSETFINLKQAIQICITFILVFGCFLAIILIFEKNLNSIKKYTLLYNTTTTESIGYQKIFDNLREYFFDPNSYTGNTAFKKMVENELNKIYSYQKKSAEEFQYDELPSSFKNHYLNLTLNDLCPYSKELFDLKNIYNYDTYIFKNNYQCHNLTENTSEYGLNVLLSYYLEEIRTQKNYFENLYLSYNSSGFIYNNSLIGTEQEIIENSTDITKSPFEIFNDGKLFQLSMIRRYFLLPAYNQTLDKFYSSISSFWGTNYEILLICLIFMIIIISVFYLAYWIPNIVSMDEDIYKTKNMLSIIPKDVLTMIPGINKLLNLGNIRIFSGNMNMQNKKGNSKESNANK